MMEKDITDPDSQEGMDICLNCPLEKCELEISKVVQRKVAQSHRMAEERIKYTALKESGLSTDEIARRFNKSARTIQRRLK